MSHYGNFQTCSLNDPKMTLKTTRAKISILHPCATCVTASQIELHDALQLTIFKLKACDKCYEWVQNELGQCKVKLRYLLCVTRKFWPALAQQLRALTCASTAPIAGYPHSTRTAHIQPAPAPHCRPCSSTRTAPAPHPRNTRKYQTIRIFS